MIRQPNAQTAIDIAQEFDKRGLGIGPRDSSLLQTLHTTATVDYLRPTTIDPNGYEPTAESITNESTIVPLGATRSAHDEALDEIVGVLAPNVSQHISFAKNTVRPLVATLVSRLEAGLRAMPEEASFNPEIKRWDLPLPMLSNVFEGMVGEYANAPYDPAIPALLMPEMTGEEVIAMLPVGNKAVDADIAAWVASKGVDFFRDTWTAIFTQHGPARASFARMIEDQKQGVDVALLCFLAGKKLLVSPPEGLVTSLADYRRAVGYLIEQAGLRLAQSYEAKSRQEKAGLMILGHTDTEVVVLGPTYDKWVEAGGQSAALFGTLLTDSPRYAAGAIDAEAAHFTDTWERHNRILTATLQSRRYLDTISLLKFKVSQLVGEELQAIFGPIANNPALSFDTPIVGETIQRVNAYIESLKLEELKNIWKVATVIVAGHLFYYTDALKILQGIDTACAENPDIDPNEAALISVILYVADFISDQLVVYDL